MELPGAVLRPLGRVIGRSWKSSGAIEIDLAKQKIFKTDSKRAKTPTNTFFRRILAVLSILSGPVPQAAAFAA